MKESENVNAVTVTVTVAVVIRFRFRAGNHFGVNSVEFLRVSHSKRISLEFCISCKSAAGAEAGAKCRLV